MLKLIAALILAAFLFAGCDKDASEDDESIFYGTWVKGSNTGDTLVFQRKNGKDVLMYNASFNPLLTALTELEYSYKDNIFYLEHYLPGRESRLISSFRWQERGQSFEIEGIQLYPFLSSIGTYFQYTKIE